MVTRFTLRDLLLSVTAICLALGCYSLGEYRGKRTAHLDGYAEARDHYQVMLSSYAESDKLWDHIGGMWREYPNMQIAGEPFQSDEQWKDYVRYHATRSGWKDSGVFEQLESRVESAKP